MEPSRYHHLSLFSPLSLVRCVKLRSSWKCKTLSLGFFVPLEASSLSFFAPPASPCLCEGRLWGLLSAADCLPCCLGFLLSGCGASARKAIGILVLLGWDIAALAPATYLRRSLQRPSGRSYLGEGFVLRCFQHLSFPDADTRQCPGRDNR